MIDKMQFAAAAAAWCLRQGISIESVGLTMGQDGRFACTSTFKLVGVYTDGLPAEFGFNYLEMGEYAHELADLYDESVAYVYCPTHKIVRACGDVENGHCSVCSNEFHKEMVSDLRDLDYAEEDIERLMLSEEIRGEYRMLRECGII